MTDRPQGWIAEIVDRRDRLRTCVSQKKDRPQCSIAEIVDRRDRLDCKIVE
jgi:hypothetical protein